MNPHHHFSNTDVLLLKHVRLSWKVNETTPTRITHITITVNKQDCAAQRCQICIIVHISCQNFADWKNMPVLFDNICSSKNKQYYYWSCFSFSASFSNHQLSPLFILYCNRKQWRFDQEHLVTSAIKTITNLRWLTLSRHWITVFLTRIFSKLCKRDEN